LFCPAKSNFALFTTTYRLKIGVVEKAGREEGIDRKFPYHIAEHLNLFFPDV